jgi:hypothetical protein
MNEKGSQNLLDERAAAHRLGGISVKTLQAWRLKGKPPIFRKIGSRVFYLESDLIELIQRQARTSTSQRVER